MKGFWESAKKWIKKRALFLSVIVVGIGLSTYTFIGTQQPKATAVSYVKFEQMMKSHDVKTVTINLDSSTFQFQDTKNKSYATDNPKYVGFKKYLLESNVKVTETNDKSASMTSDLVSFSIKMILMLIVLKIVFDLFSSSKFESIDEASDNVPKVDFGKIAGNQEAKEEMQFLVDFLKNPKKFKDMGAKLPRGVVFYGAPGTGKTLTAKAIAGEAKVPFFSISGSDFVELYAGLGAKRVRDLFKKARKKAPCIIFIDEIDAVGTKRGSDNNSEKDQTINALLNELDGFNGSENIVVICATNRIEDLDSALIRPGRFDKHIAIGLPDKHDRLEILNVHTKNKPISPEVSLDELAKLTIGFSGAGLESLVNEATILAVTRDHQQVTKDDIDDAYFKIVMKGHKKKNQKEREQDEIELVAWHESGHALVSKLLTTNEVPKVTITSSTSGAGGVTFITPKKMGLFSKEELINNVKVLYGGRVAELLLLGDENRVTTGASSDIGKATEQIKLMISEYGMSKSFGMIKASSFDSDDKVLQEAVELSNRLYEDTISLLSENKPLLETVARKLIEKECLSEDELDEIIDSYRNSMV